MSDNDNTGADTHTSAKATAKTGIQKHFNEEGSQSKPVVLVATLFIVALGLFCAYLLFRGPDEKNVFFFLRHGVIFYPLMALGVFVTARVALLGFKRLKTM